MKLKPFGYVDDYLINKTALHITVYLYMLVSINLHLANEKHKLLNSVLNSSRFLIPLIKTYGIIESMGIMIVRKG